jgi:hypothetical protein
MIGKFSPMAVFSMSKIQLVYFIGSENNESNSILPK